MQSEDTVTKQGTDTAPDAKAGEPLSAGETHKMTDLASIFAMLRQTLSGLGDDAHVLRGLIVRALAHGVRERNGNVIAIEEAVPRSKNAAEIMLRDLDIIEPAIKALVDACTCEKCTAARAARG